MALIQCPECAREVSDRAVSCPQCGFPVAKEVGTILPEEMEVGPCLPKVVDCLDCKTIFSFEDEVCPNCGLFNSQKYRILEENGLIEELKPTVPQVKPENEEGIKCPKCGAKNSHFAAKQGFGIIKFVVGNCIVGPVTGLLTGRINSNKIVVACLKCGHRWRL